MPSTNQACKVQADGHGPKQHSQLNEEHATEPTLSKGRWKQRQAITASEPGLVNGPNDATEAQIRLSMHNTPALYAS